MIAAIGFGNYILLKLYGTRGVEIEACLGGLVNTSVTVSDLPLRVRSTGSGLAQVGFLGKTLCGNPYRK